MENVTTSSVASNEVSNLKEKLEQLETQLTSRLLNSVSERQERRLRLEKYLKRLPITDSQCLHILKNFDADAEQAMQMQLVGQEVKTALEELKALLSG
ncbi:hypothetical protein [Aliikangiella sp. G2MR2-5]|uniref:hypothetical protein n=1 Tax=Aliikangiella sp. G2MR2-5 TaxID=2788943 RepID=UPI0018ABD84A|nr:hypothetical protein [Aliikangiella sp. G2MR2-5]